MNTKDLRNAPKPRLFISAIIGLLTIVSYGHLLFDVYEKVFPKTPKITFDVTGSINLANLKGAGSDVKILYKNTELSQAQALTAYVVNVKNDSPKDLSKLDFDSRHNFGIALDGDGIFIAAEIIRGPNPYLAQDAELNIRSTDKKQLMLSPFVFNSDESFELKVFVLQDESKELKLTPIGQLTGIKAMDVTYSFKTQHAESFLRSAFRGTLFIHMVRLIFYGTISFCIAALPFVFWHLLFFKIPKLNDRRKLLRLERRLTEHERNSPEFRVLKAIVDRVRPLELNGHLPNETCNYASYLFKDSLGGGGWLDKELHDAILLPPEPGSPRKFTPKFIELSKRLKAI